MPYFDADYFDAVYFLTDGEEAAPVGRGGRVAILSRIAAPDPDADEAYLLALGTL